MLVPFLLVPRKKERVVYFNFWGDILKNGDKRKTQTTNQTTTNKHTPPQKKPHNTKTPSQQHGILSYGETMKQKEMSTLFLNTEIKIIFKR